MIFCMAMSNDELDQIKQYVKNHQGMNTILADRIFAELDAMRQKSRRKIELERLAKQAFVLLSSLVSNLRRRKRY